MVEILKWYPMLCGDSDSANEQLQQIITNCLTATDAVVTCVNDKPRLQMSLFHKMPMFETHYLSKPQGAPSFQHSVTDQIPDPIVRTAFTKFSQRFIELAQAYRQDYQSQLSANTHSTSTTNVSMQQPHQPQQKLKRRRRTS